MPGKETLVGTPIGKPYFSTSLQVAPGNKGYRPNTGRSFFPQPTLTYY
jgi:hypothetical protein